MRARPVKGLDRNGPLADQLERIIAARLDELLGFMPQAADPAEVEALHDLRIAAKRLRYVLELGEHLLGPYAKTAHKRVKALQDLVGVIHDCDVTIPRVRALNERLTDEDVHALTEDPDRPPPHVHAHRGLTSYEVLLRARRNREYARFLDLWRELEREGFAARLRYAAAERPEAEAPSPDVHEDHAPGEDAAEHA